MGEGKYNRYRLKLTPIFPCFNIVFVNYAKDFPVN